MKVFEEYRCGCVSDFAPSSQDLPGYCGTHGDDYRKRHKFTDKELKEAFPALPNQPNEQQHAR